MVRALGIIFLFGSLMNSFMGGNFVFGLISIPTESFQWTLSNSNGSISVKGNVPGGVYTDLMEGGVLDEGDFYYRYNDLDYRWVSYEEWTYSTVFEIPESVTFNGRIAFEFDGLDTIPGISINGETVDTTCINMFARCLLDVKYLINEEKTVNLSLAFQSPVEFAQRMYNSYYDNYGYYVVPECVNDAFKGECHVNFIRKMQSSFSWDWGPAFPNTGIWKPWRILSWTIIALKGIYFESVPITNFPDKFDPDFQTDWVVYFKVFYDLGDPYGTVFGDLKVYLEGDLVYRDDQIVIEYTMYGNRFFEGYFTVPKGRVETWWPNGYGDQPLYEITATFSGYDYHQEGNSSVKARIGFRTVELDQSFVNFTDPTAGRYYRIKVNNINMFMRGSNWIPAHVLPEVVTPEYTRQLLTDARDAHQNCIRVWGGGIYESDHFYEIADELGILIWQDMMFACNMYPADENFLNNVLEEVKTQFVRLQHHPSVLLWSTNNENELALKWNWYGTKDNYEQYKRDYIKLYVNTVAHILREWEHSRPVVISSPSNGVLSEELGYISPFPISRKYGDVHYYLYFINGWNYKSYFATRFTSEYGFQSFPSYQTLLPVMDEEDLAIDSPMMEHRQHHPNGNKQIESQLKAHFDYEKNSTSFQYYLYLVQLHQAIAVKTETEFYRRMRDTLQDDGSGFTMGALYWQLNDIWQGASWSSIEYGGRWKILHYFVKKFFNPLIIVPWIQNEEFKVTIVSDLPKDIHISEVGILSLELRVILFNQDLETRFTYDIDYDINSESAVLGLELDLKDDLNIEEICGQGVESGNPYDNCFVTVALETSNGTLMAPENFLLLGEPKDAFLPPVTFQIGVEAVSNVTINIFITADRLALFVFLESPFEGIFSDNGFLIPWTTESEVQFFAREPIALDQFRDTLNITYLTNSYDDL